MTKNDTSGSGLNGHILDPITTTRSRGVVLVNYGNGRYGRGTLYIYIYLFIFFKMCHKLLYAKFGVLDWCYCHMKKYQFN